MLLESRQYGEIALVQCRTAVPLDITRPSALLLVGSALLCQGGTRKKNRHSAGDKDIVIHGTFLGSEGDVIGGRLLFWQEAALCYLPIRSSPN